MKKTIQIFSIILFCFVVLLVIGYFLSSSETKTFEKLENIGNEIIEDIKNNTDPKTKYNIAIYCKENNLVFSNLDKSKISAIFSRQSDERGTNCEYKYNTIFSGKEIETYNWIEQNSGTASEFQKSYQILGLVNFKDKTSKYLLLNLVGEIGSQNAQYSITVIDDLSFKIANPQ